VQANIMRTASLLPQLLLAAVALDLVPGCQMETANDVYMNALAVEGDAERNVCRLVFDTEAKAHVLDSGKVKDCLERNREALTLYEKAEKMGQTGLDFQYKLEDARERVKKLESMYKTVKLMETDHAREQVGAPVGD
jgi:hypothetical protein